MIGEGALQQPTTDEPPLKAFTEQTSKTVNVVFAALA
jgi:hypothetical protein